MNKDILHTDVQEFISKNLSKNITDLVLQGSPFTRVSIQEIAQQIVGKQKAKQKLPRWFATKDIYYPPKVNLEQTSSEVTAKYKASLVTGSSCLDLTGGFGIDAYFFSKVFKQVIHCELDYEISNIAKHNSIQLKTANIDFFTGDGLTFLKNHHKKFDCIYADPSRRNLYKERFFLLEDCQPNIPNNLELLFKYTDTILLKYSPMLDIQKGIKSLTFVKEVHVVAVNNEVKELLFLLQKDYHKSITIQTINFNKKKVQYFGFNKDQSLEIDYASPLTYLYLPNAAILKSGGFMQIANQYNLFKLHQHSHLYTHNKLIEFPGNVFKILDVLPYSKTSLKQLAKTKANVSVRNFPLSVAQLTSKIKISDGGNTYLFFTTNMHKNLIVIKAEKV